MKKTKPIHMKSFIALFLAISSVSIGLVSAHPHHPENQELKEELIDEEILPVISIKEIPHTH
ncbi:MAG TPA: hypothetical protein DCM40_26650 [Maribacter sp.]|nr:hypothetical protein [Maribacter sp.]